MKEIITAFMQESLPCNPIPLANALTEGVRTNGTSWITTDEAKAILHLLNQMAYGQWYEINSMDEFKRLTKILFFKYHSGTQNINHNEAVKNIHQLCTY